MTQSGGLSADAQGLMTFEANKKSAGTAYLLWFFTGGFGGHRFYLGQTQSAVVMLILALIGWATVLLVIGFIPLAIVGIWALIDLFSIGKMVEAHNTALMARINVSAKPSAAPVDELAKFAALRDQGAISDEEYAEQKARLIGVAPTNVAAEV